MDLMPLDIYRIIRSYLTPKEAHRFSMLARHFRPLHSYYPFEISMIYQNVNLDQLIMDRNIIGAKYIISKKQTSSALLTQYLVLALSTANIEISHILINSGAHLNGQLLVLAAETGSLEIVQELVQNGLNLSKETYLAAMKSAVSRDYLNIVRYLHERGGHLESQLLFLSRSITVLDYLLQAGLNIHDIAAKKLLYRAIRNSDLEIVYFLVEHGISLNNHEVLYSAIRHPDISMFSYLVKKGALIDISLFESAIENQSLPQIRYLIEYGQLLIPRHLTIAVGTGNLEIVGYLISQGADPDNIEAYSMAKKCGYPEIIDFLNGQSHDGRLPIHRLRDIVSGEDNILGLD